MKYRILQRETAYTGRELRSGWVAVASGMTGDAAVGFIGRCDVANEDLVDLDDAMAGTFIRSRRMAHVVVEHACGLDVAVLRQRLLVALLCEVLTGLDIAVTRDGDDIYCRERKLTVSIAAPSATSCLIHLGINVDPEGAPVPAIGLAELGVDAREILDALLSRYKKEIESCAYAESKVKSVP